METNFYNDDFEQLLKEKSDEFRMYPSKRVWHSIYNDLHPGRKWPSVAVSMLLITALFMAGYWNSNSDKTVSVTTVQKNTSQPENNSSTNIIASVAAANQIYVAPISDFSNTTNFSPKDNLQKNTVALVKANNLKKNFSSPANNSGNQNIIKENQSAQQSTPAFELLINTSALNNKTALDEITGLPINNEEEIIANTHNSQKTNSDFITGIITAPVIDKENTEDGNKETKSLKTNSFSAKQISTEDKAWMENYALHNKSERKKWKERSTATFYVTPNVGYRKLYNDPKYNFPPMQSSLALASSGPGANQSVNQNPGLGIEAGFNFNYAVAKNIRFTAGLQGNFTNYAASANETNHPVSATLMLIDQNTGYTYLHSSSSTLANTYGYQPKKIHNKTYQISIPVGFAVKLYGNDKIEWFSGATIQPTFVLGGKAYLISADRKNYVADASAISKWNLNTGFETYVNYKFDGFTLQAGPQFRYQLLSTYDKKYTVKENLYNIGVKVGVVKSF
jgi:hypothetical protein